MYHAVAHCATALLFFAAVAAAAVAAAAAVLVLVLVLVLGLVAVVAVVAVNAFALLCVLTDRPSSRDSRGTAPSPSSAQNRRNRR